MIILKLCAIAAVTAVCALVLKSHRSELAPLCIAAGGLLFLRGSGGLIKGAAYGAVAVAATYVIYSAIAGSFAVTWLFAVEVLLGAAAGAVSGVIGVNMGGRG